MWMRLQRSKNSSDKDSWKRLKGSGPKPITSAIPPTIQRAPTTTLSQGGGTHTVTAGDTLWSIATKVYGHGYQWKRIRDANTALFDGSGRLVLHVGMVLKIPRVDVPLLEALHDARNETARRKLALSISSRDYEAMIQALGPKERESEAAFLQQLEILRSSGMTLEELAAKQTEFIKAKAKKQGISEGELIRQDVETTGYGGEEALWWPGLTPEEKDSWTGRFYKAVAAVRAKAPPEIKAIIEQAESRGGGFHWAPLSVQRNKAFGFTYIDFSLYVGKEWVESAEKDPTSVFANIAHEMGGHNRYGEVFSGMQIMSRTLEALPASERAKAQSGRHSLLSTFGYPETEIYSELYEASYDREDNPTDRPFEFDDHGKLSGGDVVDKLEQLKNSFAPVVVEAIVRGLWRRIQLDRQISAAVRNNFATAVEKIFSFKLR